ncbi:hypothetical protein [Arenibacter latericius]|uniref:hypothetical protein n=1 Tax=Arenibacter latericius TaxID=86104 RepID=UPI0012F75E8A|nr:hypothetical protein [Arenibacter latericius]MDX1362822.1 hypothetical protein [Arenibacter latericius]
MRSELTMTKTELKLIAKAAFIGDNRSPNTGYNTPATMGTKSIFHLDFTTILQRLHTIFLM